MLGFRKSNKDKHSSLATNYKWSDRRDEREDRRAFGPPSRFPLFDCAGKFIKLDRRSMPDRRIANIKVKEDYLTFDKNRFVKNWPGSD